jgi:hypothetical protein
MNDIVDFGVEDETNEAVVLGSEQASSKISFQLAQDFYSEITGKSENLKERENDSFILTLSNIEQLDYRINQLTEQYNICSSSEIYSIKYVDDSSERFSSLERLKLHAGSKGSAVEEINIQYNLLIILPKTQRPQEYKVKATLVSRVSKIEKMKDELGPIAIGIPLYQFERMKTAIFSIDYIDASVANALMSSLKSWFNGLEKSSTSKPLKFGRSVSHYFPALFKYSLLALSCYYSYTVSEQFVAEKSTNLHSTSLYILSVLLTVFLSYKAGDFLGRKAEISLDKIYEPSYIKLSEADETFVRNASTENTKNLYIFFGSTLFTTLLGVFSSIIASKLTG